MNDVWKLRFIGLSIVVFLPALVLAGDRSIGNLGNKQTPPFRDTCGNLIGANKAVSPESDRKQRFPSPADVWIYTAHRGGTLQRRIHQTSAKDPNTGDVDVTFSPKDAGNKIFAIGPLMEGGPGWNTFQHLFSLNGRVYAVTKDRELVWYEGKGIGQPDGYKGWSGPHAGIRDRDRFKYVFPMGSYEQNPWMLGVIYAIDDNGDLWWYRHRFVEVQGGCRKIDNTRWDGPRKVKSALTKYAQVFSGGDGVIYGLDQKGILYWQKHQNWSTGETLWEEPRPVHADFRDAAQIFGAGNGIIYKMDGQGHLVFYRHKGWRDGSDQWEYKEGLLIESVPELHSIFAYIPPPPGFYP